jgi:hypothetical protein
VSKENRKKMRRKPREKVPKEIPRKTPKGERDGGLFLSWGPRIPQNSVTRKEAWEKHPLVFSLALVVVQIPLQPPSSLLVQLFSLEGLVFWVLPAPKKASRKETGQAEVGRIRVFENLEQLEQLEDFEKPQKFGMPGLWGVSGRPLIATREKLQEPRKIPERSEVPKTLELPRVSRFPKILRIQKRPAHERAPPPERRRCSVRRAPGGKFEERSPEAPREIQERG